MIPGVIAYSPVLVVCHVSLPPPPRRWARRRLGGARLRSAFRLIDIASAARPDAPPRTENLRLFCRACGAASQPPMQYEWRLFCGLFPFAYILQLATMAAAVILAVTPGGRSRERRSSTPAPRLPKRPVTPVSLCISRASTPIPISGRVINPRGGLISRQACASGFPPSYCQARGERWSLA